MDAVVQSLADPIRREILRMLGNGPMTVGEIVAAFSVSRPAISRHLRVLREAGLVSDAPVGRERTYQRTLEVLAELETFLAELRAPNVWKQRFLALETEVHRVKRKRRNVGHPHVRRHNDKKESA